MRYRLAAASTLFRSSKFSHPKRCALTSRFLSLSLAAAARKTATATNCKHLSVDDDDDATTGNRRAARTCAVSTIYDLVITAYERPTGEFVFYARGRGRIVDGTTTILRSLRKKANVATRDIRGRRGDDVVRVDVRALLRLHTYSKNYFVPTYNTRTVAFYHLARKLHTYSQPPLLYLIVVNKRACTRTFIYRLITYFPHLERSTESRMEKIYIYVACK